jgi:hypothetical protein
MRARGATAEILDGRDENMLPQRLRVACIVFICIMAVPLALAGPAYILDPYRDYEPIGWGAVVALATFLLLLLAAAGVLKRKPYAWWTCEVVLAVECVFSIRIAYPPFVVFFLFWLIAFSFDPPWRWPRDSQELGKEDSSFDEPPEGRE